MSTVLFSLNQVKFITFISSKAFVSLNKVLEIPNIHLYAVDQGSYLCHYILYWIARQREIVSHGSKTIASLHGCLEILSYNSYFALRSWVLTLLKIYKPFSHIWGKISSLSRKLLNFLSTFIYNYFIQQMLWTVCRLCWTTLDFLGTKIS